MGASLQISAGYMDIPTQTEHLSRFRYDSWTNPVQTGHLSRFQRDIWTYLRKPNISPDFTGIYGQTYANRASLQISTEYMDRPTQTEHLSRFQRDTWTDICKRVSLQISTGFMDIPTQTEHLSRFHRDIWTYLRKQNISPDSGRIPGQTRPNWVVLQISVGFLDRHVRTG